MILLIVCLIAHLSTHPAVGGQFEGARLAIDTQIENGAQNDHLRTLTLPVANQTIDLQLFIEGHNNSSTTGFNLTFDRANGTFETHYLLVSGNAFDGPPLTVQDNRVSTLLSPPQTIPLSGHLCSVTLV